jgi:ribonuclease T1
LHGCDCKRADTDSPVSPPCAILLIDACMRQAAIAVGPAILIAFPTGGTMSTVQTRLRPDWWLAAALAIVALGACLAAPYATGKGSYATEEIRIDALPAEGRDVLERIRSGRPLLYERDGVVFGNREGLLPAEPRGYYHEYTVKTPAQRSRGARRIVCGGAIASTSECYYSNDHYRSFKRIRQ